MTDVKLGKYKHFKGDLMEVLGVAQDSETLEEFIVYRHISGERANEKHFWARPKAMFLETVERDGKVMPRFQFVEE